MADSRQDLRKVIEAQQTALYDEIWRIANENRLLLEFTQKEAEKEAKLKAKAKAKLESEAKSTTQEEMEAKTKEEVEATTKLEAEAKAEKEAQKLEKYWHQLNETWDQTESKTWVGRFLDFITRGNYSKAQKAKWYNLYTIYKYYEQLNSEIDTRPIRECLAKWDTLNNLFVMTLSERRHPWFDQLSHTLNWAISGGLITLITAIALGNPFTWGTLLLGSTIFSGLSFFVDPASKLNLWLDQLKWPIMGGGIGIIISWATGPLTIAAALTTLGITIGGIIIGNIALPSFKAVLKKDENFELTFSPNTYGPSSQLALDKDFFQGCSTTSTLHAFKTTYKQVAAAGITRGNQPMVKYKDDNGVVKTIMKPSVLHPLMTRHGSCSRTKYARNKEARDDFYSRLIRY